PLAQSVSPVRAPAGGVGQPVAHRVQEAAEPEQQPCQHPGEEGEDHAAALRSGLNVAATCRLKGSGIFAIMALANLRAGDVEPWRAACFTPLSAWTGFCPVTRCPGEP